MKFLYLLAVLALFSEASEYDIYHLVTGKKLSCNKIISNICVENDVYEIDSIIAAAKNNLDDEDRIFSIEENKKDSTYKIISGVFSYDFKERNGHGAETVILLNKDLSLVKKTVILWEP